MKSTKNYLILVLFLVVVSGGMFAWQQYQELLGLRGSALNATERASLQKRLKDAQDRARELEAMLAAALGDNDGESGAVAAADANPNNNAAGRGAGRGGRGGGRGNQAALQAVLQNPQVQRLLAVQQKAALDARYAGLVRNLNLSPEQGDKLKTLIADGQAAQQDAWAAARAAGVDPRTDPQGLQRLLADAQAQSDANIKAAIGESGFAALQQYDRTTAQRNVVTQLQQQLSFTTPLSGEQAEQLVQVLATTSPQRGGANGGAGGQGFGGRGGGGFGGGGGGFGGGGLGAIAGNFGGGGGGFGVGANVPITTAAITQAQTFLSPAQVQALQQMQQTQQAQTQVQQLLQQAGGGRGQPGGGAQRGGNGGGRRAAGTGN